MIVVLVIASDAALQASWSEAVRSAGFGVRSAPALSDAVDLLNEESIDGVLIDARAKEDLALFATLSACRPLPPTMLVSDLDTTIATRVRAAMIRSPRLGASRLVSRLGSLLAVHTISSATNLPLRLTPVATKWTFRGEVERPPAVDGETEPDGWSFS